MSANVCLSVLVCTCHLEICGTFDFPSIGQEKRYKSLTLNRVDSDPWAL